MWRTRQHRQDDQDMSGENRVMLRAIDARMRRALLPAKVLIAAVILLAMGLVGVTGWLVNKSLTHPLTNQIVANNIANCNGNNTYRADQTKIWQDYLALQGQESKDTAAELAALISALANGNKSEITEINAILVASGKTDTADQDQFIQKVMAVNSPRNCVAANQVDGVTGK